jgi:mannose-6-phosphate isomerase-like protein (cupin superfamily)
MSSEWPAELDALIAAPDHHKLLMENEHVRVLETKINPGETVPVHTHQNPSTNYFFSWSDCIRRDDNGEILFDSCIAGVSVEPGATTWQAPLPPHTLENVGDCPIHLISVELKNTTGT